MRYPPSGGSTGPASGSAPGPAAGPGRRPRLGFAVVRGDSMRPLLRPRDRLLVSYRRRPRAGDVVVARFADGTTVVKRAAERRTSGWWLLSDDPAVGVDSRHRGPVSELDVLGVARVRVWPRPRIL